jgi:hypothetical protein
MRDARRYNSWTADDDDDDDDGRKALMTPIPLRQQYAIVNDMRMVLGFLGLGPRCSGSCTGNYLWLCKLLYTLHSCRFLTQLDT